VLADLIDLAGSPVALLYAVGLSLSLAGILLEASLSAALRRSLYSARDTAANLLLYAGFFALNLVWARGVFAIYAWTSDRALVQWPIGGFHLGQDGLWWEWLALFLLEDLCFYLFHRASHRCRVLWASHVTHHSSAHFNLSVAFRQTWVPFFAVLFWLPLLLVGFDPLMVMSVQVFSLFYQELLHTQLIPRLGPLEWIFNTPRHHAVHHGSNPVYLDRNYGGVLILWDRLLGTYAARSEPIRFGLTTGLSCHNPLVIAFHEWIAMGRGLVRSRSPGEALRALFGPPGDRAPIGTAPPRGRMLDGG
jgi:sterol desaturase/sphingolipid hydroxylase (fatty acid hydroxylase superfamily)